MRTNARSPEAGSLQNVKSRFVWIFAVIFAVAAVSFIALFSFFRLERLHTLQVTRATSMVTGLGRQLQHVNPNDQDAFFNAFSTALHGDRLFDCLVITDGSSNQSRYWPSESCVDATSRREDKVSFSSSSVAEWKPGLQITAFFNRTATLDDFAEEFWTVLITAISTYFLTLVAGYIGLHFAVRKPIRALMSNVVDLIETDVGVSRGSKFRGEIAQLSRHYLQVISRLRDLRRQEALRRSVTQTAFDCVITIDEDGKILEFNPAAEDTFGFRAENVVGQTLKDTIVPERFREAHTDGMKRYLKTGERRVIGNRIEIIAVRCDGEEIPIELAISAADVDDRQYFTAYLRDISDRIAQDQELMTAKESAEAGSRAKSMFLAMMGHEIRTPLNGVIGALGLIERKNLAVLDNRYINVAQQSAKQLLIMINDILDFSKIEAGKLDLETSVFDLFDTIEDILAVSTPKAIEKGIDLNAEIDDDTPMRLVGDAVRIQQVLMNLTSNAVKFTESGSVFIKVSTPQISDQEATIRFAISDTGVGIQNSDLKIIFDEFWTKRSHTKDGLSSSGLGLSICKRLVDMMGGDIGCNSTVDVGSTFWFELNLKRPTGAEDTVEKMPHAVINESKEQSTDVHLSGRVLIGEDNPTNQLIVRAMLERLGLQVEVMADGGEVVDAISTRPFDLVLMDIGMPNMDGLEATAAIRAMPTSIARIPIVAMTAYAMHGDRDRILAHGLDAYVSKPINRQELIATLRQWLPMPDDHDASRILSVHESYIDQNIFNELIGNVGAGRIHRIVATYLEELSQRVQSINEAHLKSDIAALEREAHPLKSSSAEIGASVLAAIAAEIETAARANNGVGREAAIASLNAAAKSTRDDLEWIRENL